MGALTRLLLTHGVAGFQYTLSLLVIALGLLLFYLWRRCQYRAEDRRSFDLYPVVGVMPYVWKAKDTHLDFVFDNVARFGPTHVMLSMHLHTTVTVEPKNVAYVLKDNYDNFVKGGTFKTSLGELLGEGIFVSDGEVHRQQRKTTAGIFTGNTFRGVITDGLFEELDLLIGLMDRWSASGEAFDFSKVMHALTMNLFGKVGFRRDFRLLERFPEEIPFTSAFDDAVRIVSCRFSNPLFRLTEWWSGEGERLRDNIRTIDAFAYDCIAEHRARHRPHAQASVAPPHADGSREPTVSAQHRDLLDMFMACRNPDRTPWSDVQLRDMLLNTIIAGRDTTAQALAWAMYELLRHPAVAAKMRAEARACLAPGQYPTFDMIKALPYTNAVFNETLRLHSIVPANMKEAVNACVLPSGDHVPKGGRVAFHPYTMGRSTTIWGPDALAFKPERWIDAEGRLIRESPTKWPAFNAGPRVCLGQQMATMEGVAVLAVIIQRYTFASHQRDLHAQPMAYARSLTLPMKDPFMCTVRVG